MEYPFTVESQEQLDGIISGRIQRIKSQYSDYDDVKKSLKSALEERDSLASKVDDLMKSNQALTGEVDGLKSAAEQQKLRSAIATEMGLPENVLRGSNKEELEAHAQALKQILKPMGGASVPAPGSEPEAKESTGIEFMKRLFNSE